MNLKGLEGSTCGPIEVLLSVKANSCFNYLPEYLADYSEFYTGCQKMSTLPLKCRNEKIFSSDWY